MKSDLKGFMQRNFVDLILAFTHNSKILAANVFFFFSAAKNAKILAT